MNRRRPIQDVRIWSIQDRTNWEKPGRRPFVVRWVVDGQKFSKAHDTRARADRYRSRLLVAAQDGETFELRQGEPVGWSPAADDLPVYLWARTWVAQEWRGWAPHSRRSVVESLERFLPLVCDEKAPPAPAGLRRHLRATLPPDAEIDPQDESELWLGRWGLSLRELNRDNLADVERRLGIGDADQTLARATAGRFRKNAHACIRRAVELGRLEVDPWPPTPKGRNRRKSERKRQAVDVKRLPDPKAAAEIIQAMRSHQPGSRVYQLMSAVMYYAGPRPAEVVMLRPRALTLPEEGWGSVHVTEADVDWDVPGEPKTGEREAPLPPELVRWLAAWIEEHELGPDDLLFRTRTGGRPTPSNWNRSIKRACRQLGRPPLWPYAWRHACATSMLRAGVPLGEVARWLGHSVETLVTVYVGALEGDDALAKQRLDAAASTSRRWMVDPEASYRASTANTGRRRRTAGNNGPTA